MNREPVHEGQQPPTRRTRVAVRRTNENRGNIPLDDLFPDTYEHESPLLPLVGNLPRESWRRGEQYTQRSAINFAGDMLQWGLLPSVPYSVFAEERAGWDEPEMEMFNLAIRRDAELRRMYQDLEAKGQNEWAQNLKMKKEEDFLRAIREYND